MPKVLVADLAAPVTAAVKKFLSSASWEVDVSEGAAGTGFDPEGHEVVIAASEKGKDQVSAIKARAPWTPVVLVFPPDVDDAFHRALELGADGVLIGPLKRPAVLSCINGMARVRALTRQIADLESRLAQLPPPELPDEPKTAPELSAADDGPTATLPNAPAQRDDDEPLTPHEGTPAAARTPPEGSTPSAGSPTVPAPRTTSSEVYDFEFFKKLLLMEIKRSSRYRYPISLVLVAVDSWPEVSRGLDAKGRGRLLGGLLAVITRAVRDIDLPLLYAEDKFLVFLPHTPGTGALQVAERLCERTRLHPADPSVTVSAGVASFEGSGEGTVSFATLIKDATDALRKAQLGGGDRAERTVAPSPVAPLAKKDIPA